MAGRERENKCYICLGQDTLGARPPARILVEKHVRSARQQIIPVLPPGFSQTEGGVFLVLFDRWR